MCHEGKGGRGATQIVTYNYQELISLISFFIQIHDSLLKFIEMWCPKKPFRFLWFLIF